MKKRFIACLAAGLAFASSVSAGTVTFFNNEAAYDAATAGNTTFLNFDGLPVGNSNGDFGTVDFNTIGAVNPDNIVQNSNAITDAGDPSTPFNVGVLQGVFSAPIFAMAMEISSGSIEGLDLFDSGGTSIGGISGGGYVGFVGIVSDMAFSRFDVLPNVFGPAPNQYDRIFIDDFRITTPVPLPAGGVLLLAGLGALGVARRRRG